MPNKAGQCPRCGTSNASDFAKSSYYCKKCNRALRNERLARDRQDPLAEEKKFQRQLLRSMR